MNIRLSVQPPDVNLTSWPESAAFHLLSFGKHGHFYKIHYFFKFKDGPCLKCGFSWLVYHAEVKTYVVVKKAFCFINPFQSCGILLKIQDGGRFLKI